MFQPKDSLENWSVVFIRQEFPTWSAAVTVPEGTLEYKFIATWLKDILEYMRIIHIWIYLHLHVYNIYIYVTMCCYICQLVDEFFPGFLWNRCNIFRLLQGGHWCHPTRKVKRDDKKAPATGTPAAAAASFWLGRRESLNLLTLIP